MTKTLVVANPVSGHGRSAEVVPQLLEALAAWGVEAEAVFTTADTRAGALEEAILGSDIAVAVGGDGTVNRVIQAVVLGQTQARPGPAIAILPAGTGNVAARAFGFPGEISRAARIIAAGASNPGARKAVDAGLVLRDGRVQAAFLLWLGAGLDGALIHSIARRRSPFRGMRLIVEYFLEGPRTLWRYPFPRMRLESESLSGDFATVMLANVGRLAIGSLTTRSDPSDGQFDVVAIPPRSRAAWCFACLMAGLNVPDRCPGIVRSRATRMRLTAVEPIPVQIDGEPYGSLPVEVQVRPAALRLVTLPDPEGRS